MTNSQNAEERGYDDGAAAGSWVIDGNTTEETAARLLLGIEEGDPEVYDALPSAPLSGEFAGGLLPRDLLAEYDLTEDDDEADDVLRAYEDGYSAGVVDEVTRSCRAILPAGKEQS